MSEEIKLIEKNSDISHARNIGWDLEVNDKPYDVYRIEGYCHRIGGRYGDNDYWCCPSDKEPTYHNLIEFDGEAPAWSIEWSCNNYTKTKWDETEVRKSGKFIIKRNGKEFYSGGARDMDYGLAKAQVCLVELQEHPISFGMRNWKEEAKDRKIYYYDEPAIIESIFEPGELWIIPDKEYIKGFKIQAWQKDDEDTEEMMNEYKDGCKVDFLDKHIWWFRKK